MRDRSKYTILVVDDEEDLRENIATLIEFSGYKVLTAAGGNEAIKIIKTQQINFVISDIRMPDGSGIELLKAITNKYPGVPVVVLVTGYSELSREEALGKGARDLLLKPIDIVQLESFIEEAIEKQESA